MQKSTTQIESTILLFIASIPEEEESVLAVGLDSEWSVDLDARHLGHDNYHQTAIVQIAYNNSIWIFQV